MEARKSSFKNVFSKENWPLSDALMKEVSEVIKFHLTLLELDDEVLNNRYTQEEIEKLTDVRALFDKKEFRRLKYLRITKENFSFENSEAQQFASSHLGMALKGGNKGLGEPLDPLKNIKHIKLYGLDVTTPVDDMFSPYECLIFELSFNKEIKTLSIDSCKVDTKFLKEVLEMWPEQDDPNINMTVSFKNVDLKDAVVGIEPGFAKAISEGKIELKNCDMSPEDFKDYMKEDLKI